MEKAARVVGRAREICSPWFSKSRVCYLRRETLKSQWVCVSGCLGKKRACLQKMLPRGEIIARCRSVIWHRSRHSQFWEWRKVVPVCGVLNVSNPYSTGNPWPKKNRQGVHKLDYFPHGVMMLLLQTVDICTERSCSAKNGVFDGFPQLLLPRKVV